MPTVGRGCKCSHATWTSQSNAQHQPGASALLPYFTPFCNDSEFSSKTLMETLEFAVSVAGLGIPVVNQSLIYLLPDVSDSVTVRGGPAAHGVRRLSRCQVKVSSSVH
ncbi:hypothetical protein BaRGS_00035937 [Batillaria attramentaria]|uniref:Uncharacterized protein n=1 Tax=Batillaria attramentaria TaxID=370345 RepID=A0ABD0JDG9_9CAEN